MFLSSSIIIINQTTLLNDHSLDYYIEKTTEAANYYYDDITSLLAGRIIQGSSSTTIPFSTTPLPLGTLPSGKISSTILALEYVGIVVLNLLSALFSGLVLGLLSLDVTELEILKKCGTERERSYAHIIIPMRRHSNLLLCSLVLGNVIVNAALQQLLDTVFPGYIGFISTTICITIFGEIVPQAVCARYGLAIGARTIWITWIVILITFPVSYPLSLVLDCALGDEIAFVFDRERLQEYIRITKSYNNLDVQEINIIMGALKIKKVSVAHVMTKLRDVFALDLNSIINYHIIQMIVKRGFSRIPVYDKNRRNIIGILMVKDLALVNPYSEVTLKSLIGFYKHPVISVDEGHTLDVVFNHFREGKSHMALVREHKKRDIVGIVTLEDIIEEVLQVEINDETDIVTDNRELRHRPDAQIPTDLDALHTHLNEAIARRRAKDMVYNMANQHVAPAVQSPNNGGSSSSNRAQSPQLNAADHGGSTGSGGHHQKTSHGNVGLAHPSKTLHANSPGNKTETASLDPSNGVTNIEKLKAYATAVAKRGNFRKQIKSTSISKKGPK